jgi:hypothetical protein
VRATTTSISSTSSSSREGSDVPTGLSRDKTSTGGGEVSLTNVDRFGGDEWRTTFLELSSDRTLDRGRLLDSTLANSRRWPWLRATNRGDTPLMDAGHEQPGAGHRQACLRGDMTQRPRHRGLRRCGWCTREDPETGKPSLPDCGGFRERAGGRLALTE